MAFVEIGLDLQVLICTFLRPSDVLTLRKTCKTLQLVTRQRVIWVYALRRLCLENTLFLPSFPIPDMSDVELEQAAIAPRRWIEVSTSFARREVPTTQLSPTATRIIYSPFERIDTLILVPGGRYMVAYSQDGFAVWDLGYISGADCKLIASKAEPKGYFSTCKVHPTPDGMGLVIFSLRPYERCSIYEIYPQSETPQLTKIASRDLHFVDGFRDYVSVDKMIWYSFRLQETIFRVWDYRLNTSVSFAAPANVGAGDIAKVIAIQTVIVMLHEKEILIWAIPPLSPQPLDFDDHSLTLFPPAIRIKFPDVPSPHPSPRSRLTRWNIMPIWYLGPSKPLYFDKVYSKDFEVQRFKIIIKPDLGDATLHYINTLRSGTSDSEIPFQSMFFEDTLVYSWSASDLGCTGMTLACVGSTPLRSSAPLPHPSTGIIQVSLPPDRSCMIASICSVSGRIVTGSDTKQIVVYDFLPHQRL